MPRRARLVAANIPMHLIQRGNNRHACFFVDADYLVYLDMLRSCAMSSACAIHAYVLMTNHVHLLISPAGTRSPGELMKALGQRYVQYINRRHGRTGSLWEGRYRSCLVDESGYLLTCHRYIELNPVRAGMVAHPAHYKWSSYRSNAYGVASSVITPHEIYDGLGSQAPGRLAAYRHLFDTGLDDDTLEQVRHAVNGNFALGSESFVTTMADRLGRHVLRQPPGRHRAEN